MKNIHLIPTDKPSRLWTNNLRRRLELDEFPSQHPSNIAKNIYITSDEEIKMDDWYLDDTNSVRQAITECESYWTHRKKYQKIILTTDQDLIKDGVQAIDNEFLEWFIKNPSCEEVKVRKNPKVNFIVKGKGVQNFNQGYKIIIPKVEPKQETLKEEFYKYGKSLGISINDLQRLMLLSKQQQERSYSEEEVLNFTQTTIIQYKFGNTNIEQMDLLKETLQQFKNK